MYRVLHHLKFNCGGKPGSEFCSYILISQLFVVNKKRLLTKNMIEFDASLCLLRLHTNNGLPLISNEFLNLCYNYHFGLNFWLETIIKLLST